MEGTTRVAGRVMDVAVAVAVASSLWRDSEHTKLHIPHSSSRPDVHRMYYTFTMLRK